ncbi:ClpXP protease specificity-enhancing factor [unidentified bacterial endosymbiont]|uniref:ClpXP protease specificity-enhancing factor n=1 Tax=unidentified bacterial endosymbiont TaxID=2355 RepID=UPI00209C9A12|nr:ClpXP protease specificity-enhancing factor [unidentified bacterial endosymbiont]
MKKQALTPSRPYLLRAYYHWLLDNQLTPCLVVKAPHHGVKVPLESVKDGKVVLNIAPQAVTAFEMGLDTLRFGVCFSGVPQEVVIPLAAVVGIYARENGAGTLFAEEPAYQQVTKLSTGHMGQGPARDPALDRQSHRNRTEISPTTSSDRQTTLRIIK